MTQEYRSDESDRGSFSDPPNPYGYPPPDDLPPVQPPSAGLIMQLFLVPAVIVGAIVGVYALFGKMATQELDWRQLTTDVGSENPHVRWRGALGLAQMLDADAHAGSTAAALKSNTEIASSLSRLYAQLIHSQTPSEEELKQIEFLSKALGRMDVTEVIVPVLRDGYQPGRNHDVRKHSLIGLAMLLGQLRDQGRNFDNSQVVNELIETSRESEPLFRHQSAFILGLISTPPAMERLAVLLEDPDQMVQVNAAIGFARNNQVQGVPVFRELLAEAIAWKLDPTSVSTPEEEARYFERMLMLLNAIKALSQLEPVLTVEERSAFARQLDAVANGTRDAVLRTDALKVKHELQAG